MPSNQKLAQLSFRIPETQKNQFMSALKLQGLDIADVMVPLVLAVISGTDARAFLDEKKASSTRESSSIQNPSVPIIGKSLMEFLPNLELIAAHPDTRKALRVIVRNLVDSTSLEDAGEKTAGTGKNKPKTAGKH